MRAVKTTAAVAAVVLAIAGSNASAASDYFLKIEGVQGESTAGETIEVQSFSWGTSNPSTVGPGSSASAGRVAAPRDRPSGQSTGQRQRAAVTDAGATTGAAAPAVGQMASFSVAFRESPTRASTGSLSRACATGKHFPTVVLTARGQVYTLTDVVVSSCAAEGELRRAELKGHVTLMK